MILGVLPTTLLAFALLDLALCLTPGPAVLLTIGRTVQNGRLSGACAGLGIVATNTLYFILSALGVGTLALHAHGAFTILRLVGAAYLAWLGISALRRAGAGTSVEPSLASSHASFLTGVLVQASNPKALIFFISLLPGFIAPGRSVGGQMLVLGVLSQAIEAVTLAGFVLSAARVRHGGLSSRLGAWLERASGAILLLVAIGIALRE